MTDKELLELAAKAAGLDARFCIGKYATDDRLGFFVINYGTSNQRSWNPLTDDGDALRLAVKLGMQIKRHYYEGDYYVDVPWDAMAAPKSETCKPDPYAATRRAIVRAAAEIGRSMK